MYSLTHYLSIIIAEALSAIIIVGALILPDTIFANTGASAIYKSSSLCTFIVVGLTTVVLSVPIKIYSLNRRFLQLVKHILNTLGQPTYEFLVQTLILLNFTCEHEHLYVTSLEQLQWD